MTATVAGLSGLSVAADDTTALGVGSVSVDFTMVEALPKLALVELTFPAGFDLSEAMGELSVAAARRTC